LPKAPSILADSVPYSPERHAKIVQLFHAGMNITDLAHRFSYSYWTIRNELLAEANGASYRNKRKGIG
jgi:DeoR/GlpR family transcriptional regulator of sugar metabolism